MHRKLVSQSMVNADRGDDEKERRLTFFHEMLALESDSKMDMAQVVPVTLLKKPAA